MLTWTVSATWRGTCRPMRSSGAHVRILTPNDQRDARTGSPAWMSPGPASSACGQDLPRPSCSTLAAPAPLWLVLPSRLSTTGSAGCPTMTLSGCCEQRRDSKRGRPGSSSLLSPSSTLAGLVGQQHLVTSPYGYRGAGVSWRVQILPG